MKQFKIVVLLVGLAGAVLVDGSEPQKSIVLAKFGVDESIGEFDRDMQMVVTQSLFEDSPEILTHLDIKEPSRMIPCQVSGNTNLVVFDGGKKAVFVTTNNGGSLQVCDLEAGEIIKDIRNGAYCAIAVSEESNMLACTVSGKKVEIRDLGTLKLLYTVDTVFKAHILQFFDKGTKLMTATRLLSSMVDTSIKLWNVVEKGTLYKIITWSKTSSSFLRSAAVSEDGEKVIFLYQISSGSAYYIAQWKPHETIFETSMLTASCIQSTMSFFDKDTVFIVCDGGIIVLNFIEGKIKNRITKIYRRDKFLQFTFKEYFGASKVTHDLSMTKKNRIRLSSLHCPQESNLFMTAGTKDTTSIWDTQSQAKIVTLCDPDFVYTCWLDPVNSKAYTVSWKPEKGVLPENNRLVPSSNGFMEFTRIVKVNNTTKFPKEICTGKAIKVWDIPNIPDLFKYGRLTIKQALLVWLFNKLIEDGVSVRSHRFPEDLKNEIIAIYKTFKEPGEKAFIAKKFFF